MRASRKNAKPTLLRRVLACLVSAALVVAFTPVVAWGASDPNNFTFDISEGNVRIGTTGSGDIQVTYGGGSTKDNIDPEQTITIVCNHNGSVAHSITVEQNVTAKITLSGVNIQLPETWNNLEPVEGTSAFEIATGANVSLTLVGANTLKSGTFKAGLQVPSGSSLTIAGSGSLTAEGGTSGAGIGGGFNSIAGSITITGGTVKATGGSSAAGIGGGSSSGGGGGQVTITGGVVEATGRNGAAGIGGGTSGTGGNVTITGGTVTATSEGGAGIGGGLYASNNGTFSTGTNGNAVVFASSTNGKAISDDSAEKKASWSGVVFEEDNGSVYGDSVAPTESFTIPVGKTLTIESGKTLTIPSGKTLTNNGTIINKGTINGNVSGNEPKNGARAGYLDEHGTEQTCDTAIVVSDSETTWTSGWYVVQDSDVTIGGRVTVSGDVHLILMDGCKLTVTGGIGVSDGNGLTVYGQTEGAGQLYANACNSGNAGIGGTAGNNGAYSNAGSITINGGTVTAIGSTGAGIGGSRDGGGSSITINGGTVTATSTNDGAGVGGGAKETNNNSSGNGGTITITGGTVVATGSNYGAGIGGGGSVGQGGSGGDITISGGTVVATTSGNGAGIGGGYGDGDNGDSGTFQTQEDTATSNGNAVIFASSISDKSNQDSWSGVIFEGNSEGKVYGSPTLNSDLTFPDAAGTAAASATSLTVPSSSILTIAEGKTLTIPQGSTLTNNGTITNSGKIYVDGAFTGCCRLLKMSPC